MEFSNFGHNNNVPAPRLYHDFDHEYRSASCMLHSDFLYLTEAFTQMTEVHCIMGTILPHGKVVHSMCSFSFVLTVSNISGDQPVSILTCQLLLLVTCFSSLRINITFVSVYLFDIYSQFYQQNSFFLT